MTLTRSPTAEVATAAPAQVLFREARQRRRRRWILRLTALAVVVVTGIGVGLGVGGPRRQLPPTTARRQVPTAAAADVCRADQLAIRFVREGVNTGNAVVEFAFVNKSAHQCRMNGYPKVQMLRASGAGLPTTVRDSGLFAGVPRDTVVLRQDSLAYFALHFPDGTGYSGLVCPASAALWVTPPGSTHATVVSGAGARIEPYGGSIRHLHCGEIDVSPVEPGQI